MDSDYAIVKTISLGLMIALFLFIAGCSENCINGEDKNINVSVVENSDTPTNIGLTYHHNVTMNIVNLKNSTAKSVKIDTSYCNDFRLGHMCENNTFNIGDISPNLAIHRFFEYDRAVGQDQLDGKYQLHYQVESCLPTVIINDTIYIRQR
jgi:hypothetical protein